MKTDPLFETHYFRQPGFKRGWTRFQELIQEELKDGARVLEVGAGPANFMSEFLSQHYELEGVDISDEVLGNPFLRKAAVYDGGRLPYEDGSFDGCISYYAMEHIANPLEHLQEVARVLRPGGRYAFCTPNRWHYVTLASALLPHSVHLKVANRLRGLDSEAHDPYPTFYRANTRGAIRKLAQEAGLSVSHLNMVEPEPSYGRLHPALFYPMMAYERLVNSSNTFETFRVNIHAALRR